MAAARGRRKKARTDHSAGLLWALAFVSVLLGPKSP